MPDENVVDSTIRKIESSILEHNDVTFRQEKGFTFRPTSAYTCTERKGFSQRGGEEPTDIRILSRRFHNPTSHRKGGEEQLNSTFGSNISIPLERVEFHEYENMPHSPSSLYITSSCPLIYRLENAKQVVTSVSPFRIDTAFTEEHQVRSLGCWVYNGPGPNHDKLGRIEKNGIVTVTGKTKDNIWTRVRCPQVEGWVMSSCLDPILDRPIYNPTNPKVIGIDAGILVRATGEVALRKQPNWGSRALFSI